MYEYAERKKKSEKTTGTTKYINGGTPAQTIGIKSRDLIYPIQRACQSNILGPVVQRVFVYSEEKRKVEPAQESQKHYSKLGYETVKVNGETLLVKKKYRAEAEYMLKVIKYSELFSETPKDIPGEGHMSGHDARGVQLIIKHIIDEYPKNGYFYLFPGASGELIASVMGHMYEEVNMVFLPISGIKAESVGEVDDKGKYANFKNYLLNTTLGEVLNSEKNVLILDMVDRGHSVKTLKKMINKIDEDNNKKREVRIMSLGLLGNAIVEGVDRIVNPQADQVFVMRRIFQQYYKKKLGRHTPKTSIDEILGGGILLPKKDDEEVLKSLNLEVKAMMEGLKKGQMVVETRELHIRALMSQNKNLSRAAAISILDENEAKSDESEEVESDDSDGSGAILESESESGSD